MKKMTILTTIMLFHCFAFAQKGSKESKSSITFGTIGIKGGLTFSKFSLSGNGAANYTTSSLTSFYIGGTINIPLLSVLYIQPGLLFVGKGGNYQLPFAPPTSINTEFSPSYLEIPMNLMTQYELGTGTLFAGGGPYFSFGMGGKVKKTFVDQLGVAQIDKDASIQFGSDISNDLKKIDFGLSFLLGYQLANSIHIHGGYSFGLTNINPDPSAPTLKNSIFSIGLGYSF